MRSIAISLMAVLMAGFVTACSSNPEPSSASKRDALVNDAQTTLRSLEAKDSGLRNVVDNSYAYIVFPDVGKGGLVVGGAFGRGVVYEQGRMVGYAEINQVSAGALAGGESYSQLVVFKDKQAFDNFKANHLSFGAEATAVAVKAGAAAATQFKNGVAVFIQNSGGLMVDASLNGQNIIFKPASEPENTSSSNNMQ